VIAELEARAFAAWPAAQVEQLGGWRLRATSGVTRRANSAWTSGPVDNLADATARTEAFYAERRLPAIFQLCPLAPAALDDALAARGYAIDAPVAILTAPLAELSAEAPAGVDVRVDREIADDWFELSGGRSRFAAVQPVYRGILERIGAPGRARAGYALASVDGEPAATALGVADGPWLGVFSVSTLPDFRRRGAATALLRALARWGHSLGATKAYLQVERDNRIAFDLYLRDGFREVYGYHYRVKGGR
jgi:ribosomal protein S18 acetylase RimI-like enzyme